MYVTSGKPVVWAPERIPSCCSWHNFRKIPEGWQKRHRYIGSHGLIRSVGCSSVGSRKETARRHRCHATPKGVGLFPAGKQQAKVKLPALFLRVTCSDVLQEDIIEGVNSAVKGGATAVVLSEGIGGPANAGDLYDAALKLQDLLRERAALIIQDRTDIASAANADGVLLTPKGVPLAVALKSLKGGTALVGVLAESVRDAKTAAAQGANFVVYASGDGRLPVLGDVMDARTEQRGGSIPVIPQFSEGEVADLGKLLRSGVDGISMEPKLLQKAAMASEVPEAVGDEAAASAILQAMSTRESVGTTPVKTLEQATILSGWKEDIISEEKMLMEDITLLLERVSPEMEEKSLLSGASKQLDEPFLVVVVGEFNSGKSSVINALLGDAYLEEGVLPTTNEVSVLRYGEEMKEERQADGIAQRFLQADLLKQVSIVDTPGTNVVLERQQRLTEEYVPRADMVLFVMSADRPFTESEVRFLEYIRRWGKKVVFVVNKVDILPEDNAVEEVKNFVGGNAQKLLNLDEAIVWPVSAKLALEAKVAGIDMLERSSSWANSRFGALELFMSEFFSGKSIGSFSGESIRLKLQTPLLVAAALIDACKRQLANELGVAEKDLAAANAVRGQLATFSEEMRKDSVVQRRSARDILDQIVDRSEEFVDRTLQLSNVQTLRGYLSSGSGEKDISSPDVAKGFGKVAMGNVVEELKQVVDEHDAWLSKNMDIQVANYRSFAEKCMAQKKLVLDDIMRDYAPSETAEVDSARLDDPITVQLEEQQLVRDGDKQAEDQPETVASIIAKVMNNPSLGVELCEYLMEAEIQDAVNATAGTAVAAVGIGIVLTIVLPYTSEDFLAIALSLVIGYVALLNLPLRRGEVKGKVRRVSTEIFKELDRGMDENLDRTLKECNSRVLQIIQPLEAVFEEDVQRVKAAESDRLDLDEKIKALKSRVAAIE